METTTLAMELLKETYGVCRLDNNEQIPVWATRSKFSSITRTQDELSVTCNMNDIPQGIKCERDWRVLKVLGPLDFNLIGILAQISEVLAGCGISIFAISTYDTDYIMMKEQDLENGIEALVKEGYRVLEE